ncbi:MAG: D-alanine--D-alanine ligase [Thermaurantimonas sp.]|uniref:D-alanine--D-alanine ligase family protein n=1 Tax=Thermaurantimonas TaxID=2681566 RepID=UPI0023F4B449|nr:D-alanine--D-alanine ligase family protein [Thermaurantimonas aggregans]MCX8147765.1 D-alanine--D-alanine ligase [Thermaurantimonas aggregans]
MSKKICVAVLYGGYSAEREISLKSGKVVFDHLPSDTFDKYLVDVRPEGLFVQTPQGEVPATLSPFGFYTEDVTCTFDVAFIAIHGTPGEDGIIQGMLDMLHVPYTTGGVLPMALTFSKAECNAYVSKMGFTVPQGIYTTENVEAERVEQELGFPVFVKPAKSGSSVGVSKVTTPADLPKAIEIARQIDKLILIEQMVKGIEVSCGVTDVFGEVRALEITEIVPAGDFFDYNAKYSGKSQEITPARIRPESADHIKRTVVEVYKLLNLSGLCRMDFIVPNDSNPVLIEINTVPGLSEQSILPRQAAYLGIRLSELFSACIFNALKRRA